MADPTRDPPDDEDDEAGSGDRGSDAHDAGTGSPDDRGGADDGPPEDDDDTAEEPDEPVEGDDVAAPPIDRALVARFLGTKDALRIAAAAIRKIVPEEQVEDLAAEAIARALTSPPPRSEKVLPAWLTTIARRRAIKWLEKRARRAAYEGAMPAVERAEDAYTGAIAEDGPDEPSEHGYDPQKDTELPELLGSALDRFVRDHKRDMETRAMIRDSADGRKTYAQIAKELNTTEDAIAQRVHRFKKKYAERVRRRNRMVMLAWLGAGAAVVIAMVVAYFLWPQPPEDIGRDPEEGRPIPSVTAQAPPPDIARPTQPSASASAGPRPPEPNFKK